MTSHGSDPTTPSDTANLEDVGASQRWSRAIAIASGQASPADLTAQRRRRNRLWTAVVITAFLALAAGLLIGLALGSSDDQDNLTSDHSVISLVASLLSLALLAAGVVVSVRSKAWGGYWKTALVALTRTERRRVLQQVRGRKPLDPGHPERVVVHRHLAARMATPWGFLLIVLGIGVNLVGQVAGGTSVPFMVPVLTALVLLLAVGSVFVLRDQRRAQRFLTANSSPA